MFFPLIMCCICRNFLHCGLACLNVRLLLSISPLTPQLVKLTMSHLRNIFSEKSNLKRFTLSEDHIVINLLQADSKCLLESLPLLAISCRFRKVCFTKVDAGLLFLFHFFFFTFSFFSLFHFHIFFFHFFTFTFSFSLSLELMHAAASPLHEAASFALETCSQRRKAC